MRITDKVKFYVENSDGGGYNPETGQYEDTEELVATIPANITDLSTDRTKELFGEIDDSKLVIRTFKPIKFKWSYCLIGKSKYKQETNLNASIRSNSLIVGEIHD
jgi:hypothetical protein